jgi:hypothetical protein
MKKLLVLGLLLATACGASVGFVAATSSDGDKWPYCIRIDEPLFSTVASEMFCGKDSALVQARANERMAMHTSAAKMTVVEVGK